MVLLRLVFWLDEMRQFTLDSRHQSRVKFVKIINIPKVKIGLKVQMKLHEILQASSHHMELTEELKRTPHMEHDTDENSYVVYDANGKVVERFWYEYSERKEAKYKALKLLRKLRTAE